METDNKEKAKVITLSLYKDDIDLLNKVAGEVGVSRSELIRRMVKKFSFDEKGKYILRNGVITSHNVHYVDEKNATAEPRNGGGPSSLEPTEDIPQKTETHNSKVTMEDLRSCMGIPKGWKTNKELEESLKQMGINSIEEAIEIADARWVD